MTGGLIAVVRILIVDDSEPVREGLRMLLDEQPELQIVGEAVSGEDALARVAELSPDLVLMDLVLPGIDGIETIRRLQGVSPRPQVLVLTSYANDRHVHEALRAGAIGYLLKDILKADLLSAIASASAGKPCFYLGP